MCFVLLCRCSADLGLRGGEVGNRPDNAGQVTLPGDICQYRGTVQHELLHVLGFHHEQRRPDAGEYVKVMWENIDGGEVHEILLNVHILSLII